MRSWDREWHREWYREWVTEIVSDIVSEWVRLLDREWVSDIVSSWIREWVTECHFLLSLVSTKTRTQLTNSKSINCRRLKWPRNQSTPLLIMNIVKCEENQSTSIPLWHLRLVKVHTILTLNYFLKHQFVSRCECKVDNMMFKKTEAPNAYQIPDYHANWLSEILWFSQPNIS